MFRAQSKVKYSDKIGPIHKAINKSKPIVRDCHKNASKTKSRAQCQKAKTSMYN